MDSRCEMCLYSQSGDGGHCYMFKEKPERRCLQWRGRCTTAWWGETKKSSSKARVDAYIFLMALQAWVGSDGIREGRI